MFLISLALLGRGIAHSKSPEIYRRLLGPETIYKLFDFPNETEIPNLNELFRSIDGLSITAPYKKHFLNNVVLAKSCVNLNAINCVRRVSSTKFEGTNTDFLAVDEIYTLLENKHGPFSSVIILGDGSMSQITQVLFETKSINFQILSRKNTKDLASINLLTLEKIDPVLVINTCARQFVFKGHLPPGCIFWDYNYSLQEHASGIPLLGATYIDGIDLLEKQAIHAIKFWGINS